MISRHAFCLTTEPSPGPMEVAKMRSAPQKQFFLFALGWVALLTLVGCQPPVNSDPLIAGDTEFTSASLAASSGLKSMGMMADTTMNPAEGGADQAQIAREIEEADLVKLVDGKLYVLNYHRGLRIIDVADWSKPKLLGGLAVLGDPVEMYVVNGVAMIVAHDYWSSCRLDPTGQLIETSPDTGNKSTLYAVNIADPNHPQLISSFGIEGYVVETRRVGDVIYVAGFKNQPWWYATTESSTDQPASNGFVVSVNVADPNNVRLVQQENFSGNTDYIHATTDAVFVAGQDWTTNQSTIQYVDISDPAGKIQLRGTCTFPGRVLNRFSMDAQGTVLRVVSESWSAGRSVSLHTFDLTDPDNISALGELELVKGESLRAVRFAGDVCYAVTFYQVDPLWVIDLTDPAKPTISGELEVPGYSTYLQSDGDKLIAVGVSQDGRPTVALYDVSDPAKPAQLATLPLGDDYSWSLAVSDDKAFKVIPEAKLILIPFDTWDDQTSSSVNKLQLLDYSDNTLQKLAAVNHRGQVIRSGADIDSQVLWVLSEQALQTLDIHNRTRPVSLATLTLLENLIQYKVVNTYGIRVVSHDDSYYGYDSRYYGSYAGDAEIEVQVVNSDDPANSTILATEALQISQPQLIVINSQLACITGADKNGNARVICFDLGSLPTLTVLADKTFDFQYESGWWYFMPLEQTNNPVMLENGTLAFVTHRENYASMLPSVTTQLELVSLANPSEPTHAASLQLNDASDDMVFYPFASGNRLYFTAAQIRTSLLNLFGPPAVKYYMRTVDISDPSNPQIGEPINVPGVVVNRTDDIIHSLNPQWLNGTYDLGWQFCSLRLDGDKAVLEDFVDLPEGNPDGLQFGSGAAIISMSGSQVYPLIAYDIGVSSSALMPDYGCYSSSTIITIDLSDPAKLSVADQKEYPTGLRLVGIHDNWLIGDSNWGNQGLLWQIGADKKLVLENVFDLGGSISDVAWRTKFVDLACGFAELISVELPSE